jgi:hypothetical protein
MKITATININPKIEGVGYMEIGRTCTFPSAQKTTQPYGELTVLETRMQVSQNTTTDDKFV